MPKSPDKIESRIQEALKKASCQKKPNISALAREFDVPRKRLHERFKGRPPRTAKIPRNKVLDDQQEKAIIRWIRQLDSLHSPPTPKMIECCANQILQRNVLSVSKPAPRVGETWVYRFIQRLPDDLHLIKQKPIEKDRLGAEDIGILTHWFDLLEPYIARIPPKNIYNFDETGFQLGQGKSQKVVTSNPIRASRGIATSETNESLTAIECIAADGTVLPPYFIFKGEYQLERWYQQIPDSADTDKYRIATASKGYTTDEIAMDWIRHFHQHTEKRVSKTDARLLLMDGHGSHLTYNFLNYCEKYNIIPFCFVPHTTHLVQPLDGQPFQAYKHYFRKKNNENIQWGISTMDKPTFFVISLKFARIHSNNVQSEMPLVIGDISMESFKTVRTLRRSIQKLDKFVNENPSLDQSFTRRLDRVFQSAIQTAELTAQLQSDISQHLERARAPSSQRSRRRIPTIGPLTVKDANRQVAERAEAERKKIISRVRKRQPSKPIPTTTQRSDTVENTQGDSQDPGDINALFNVFRY
ncbi:hypothetical protein T310_3734 [Rasamsonia emersonii CBS 393.64]|uniref:HTH CENPB-type domain-containing protein n=1 Tax=Rasamsonia emersonii (strain ATCC 16479 / CBS 393.64 / IMI 116815) TaxID=1408163 RepID=A0A0F4YVI4_RASE3|nr:hypothetical protein T310_3734 [Rasamsonia emersonii CBS 393.64]KKA22239.1 hypothetical protein T310_3734 [Rasamsonia emersonii CBS 393.64]